MIDIKPNMEGLRLGLFKRHINSNDFWATEINNKHVSINYPFHFNLNILTDSPCLILIKTTQHFSNTFWALDGNILNAMIFSPRSSENKQNTKFNPETFLQ